MEVLNFHVTEYHGRPTGLCLVLLHKDTHLKYRQHRYNPGDKMGGPSATSQVNYIYQP